VHVALGLGGSVVVYAVLYYIAAILWPAWWVRAVAVPITAFVLPVALGYIEEATNVHPDYKRDIPGYAAGALIGALACYFYQYGG
jgi:uncharacterized membrane protein YoaK (UPF0700 family)